MRPSLSLKTLLRTPAKTIITFLLIAAASFALFSRVTDYAITSREMKQKEARYIGVVALDNGVPDTKFFNYSNMPATLDMESNWLQGYKVLHEYNVPNAFTPELIETFSSLSEFAAAEIRYMTGGIICDYRRLNSHISASHDWGYDYTARFVIEATYSGVADLGNGAYGNLLFNYNKHHAGDVQAEEGETILLFAGDNTWPAGDKQEDRGLHAIFFPVDVNGIYIYPMYGTDERPNSWFYLGGNPHLGIEDSLTEGSKYLIIGISMPNLFDKEQHDLLAAGALAELLEGNFEWVLERAGLTLIELEDVLNTIKIPTVEEVIEYWKSRGAVFLQLIFEGKRYMHLGDQDTIGYVPSIFELSGDYQQSEEYLRALEIAEITNKDLHTFDIVYTRNMSAIPRFNEGDMVITEGRMITSDDVNSCVVSQYFLDAYDLQLGDKLTIELGDRFFEQNAQMGAITYIPERAWNTVKTVELEIVGAYYDADPDYIRNAKHYWGYSPNTIFAPLSLLPVTPPAEHEIKPGEFSLFIENVRDLEAFLELATPLARNVVGLRASDGNWSNIKETLDASVRASFITAVLYISGAMLALLLAVYLYIGRNKQMYAIMRTLGMSKNKTQSALSLPFGVLSALAVPFGGIIGLIYISRLADREYVENMALPGGAIILCLVFMAIFIALLTLFFLYLLGKKSPLALLQGDTIKIVYTKNINAEPYFISKAERVSVIRDIGNAAPNIRNRNYSALSHVTRYIFRHIGRVKWKTAVSLTLVMILTGAMGVLVLTMNQYRELCKTVDVKGTVTGFNSNAINELMESELTQNESFYFYSDFNVTVNLSESINTLIVTNDLERYLQDDYEIEYAEGYSNGLFQEKKPLCVLGSGVAETFGLKAGDEVTFMKGDLLKSIITLYEDDNFRNMVKKSRDMENATEEEFEEAVQNDIQEWILNGSIPYKVTGIIQSDNYSQFVFTPPGDAATTLHSLYYDDFYNIKYCQFILADNEKINEVYAFLDKLKGENIEAGYFIDSTEHDNVKRIYDLIVVLFPVAVFGVVLIGLTAHVLLVLQSSKEVAILRFLGVTKRRMRCILMFEQIGLCIIGIILAAGGLMIYNSTLFARSAETLILCGGLYLFQCICAVLAASVVVTKRKILELLQVKE